MECKANIFAKFIPAFPSINRNIVECKGLSFFRSNSVVTVLIETLWNVKHKMDTGIPGALRRINRNIVECKVMYVTVVFAQMEVLIETLWNVKSIAIRILCLHDSVLIETLWNVKSSVVQLLL